MIDEYRLSICMMVKDEEKNLERCLSKLKPMADIGLAEIIIVDTGSEDSTVSIAKKYTDKVYFHKWNKNFSEMRNKSISYAKGEWIFIVDADERLDDTDKVITLLQSAELDDYNSVFIQVKNLYDYEDEDRYNVILSPRIFKNDKDFGYEGAVHNQPIFKAPNLSVDISITHYGYIGTDKELMDKKYNRTVELLKYELKKDPENLYYIYQLGVSYDMHSDFKDSLNEFRKAYNILKRKKLDKNPLYTYILGSYARIAYTNGEFTEMINIAKSVISQQNEYLDMYYLLGIAYKQLGSMETAVEYFLKYVDLLAKYNQLDISKDLTIIMYHMDKNSESNIYFELFKFYLDRKMYNDAYKYYKNITSLNQEIYAGINILIELKKYKELKILYSKLSEKKYVNTFLLTLESKLDNLENKDRIEINKIFSFNNDIYGLFNQLRLNKDKEKRMEIIKLLLDSIDFDKEPLFYAEIFNSFKDDIKGLIKILINFENINIRNIFQRLIEKENEFIFAFENYINDINEENLDLNSSRVNILLLSVLLLFNLRDNDKISKKYSIIFERYIEYGIYFVSEVYKVDKAELIYRSVNNIEDRFFLIMYLVKNNIADDNKKSAISYLIEALNTYEAMAKYIDIYKEQLFLVFEDKQQKVQKQQFEEYKIQVKKNINVLLEQGNLQDAKLLITEYKKIVSDDIEIYSLDAIIEIMEGKLVEAEKTLKDGLTLEPFNEDLLFNKSYLMDITDRKQEAIECYSNAKLFNSNSTVKINDIISDLKSIDNNNLKVIHGTIEIANQMNTMTGSIKRLGVDATTLNYYPNYLGYKSQKVLDLNSFKNYDEANVETKKMAGKIISQNDVFHFHFGSTLTLDCSDLPLLNELNKKVIMQHWGSDVRMYSRSIKTNPYIKVKNANEDDIKRKLQFLSKHIEHCIVSDYELYEYVKDCYSNIHLIRQAIDLDKYRVSSNKNNKLCIVHAPSSPEIKGTKYVLEAVEKLKQKYNFDFELVQGMSHEEAKKIYAKADIIIDQLLCGSYGLFAIEAMAMGKPVITWISEHVRDTYPKELPIISANPDTIKEKLEYMINNRDMLNKIGNEGRFYAEKYHDSRLIAKQLVDLYKSI